jgi:plastocyanin
VKRSKGLLIGGLVALALAIGAGGLAVAHASNSAGVTGSPAGAGGYGMMGGSSSGYGMMGSGGYGNMMGQGYGQGNDAPQTAGTPSAKPDRTVKLVIKSDTEHGKRGPDAQWHDAFLPSGFSVHSGETVAVEVANYDDMAHSFTAPSLGLNVTVRAGSSASPRTTTFTFTAPSRAGQYAWWCALPCDPFSMAHDGFMRGSVTVS